MAATLIEVRKFFDFEDMKQFRQEWTALTEDDRAQIREGLGNGSYTY